MAMTATPAAEYPSKRCTPIRRIRDPTETKMLVMTISNSSNFTKTGLPPPVRPVRFWHETKKKYKRRRDETAQSVLWGTRVPAPFILQALPHSSTANSFYRASVFSQGPKGRVAAWISNCLHMEHARAQLACVGELELPWSFFFNWESWGFHLQQ